MMQKGFSGVQSNGQSSPGKMALEKRESDRIGDNSMESLYTANDDEEFDPLYQSAKESPSSAARALPGTQGKRMYVLCGSWSFYTTGVVWPWWPRLI
jgi:hypothetical protein